MATILKVVVVATFSLPTAAFSGLRAQIRTQKGKSSRGIHHQYNRINNDLIGMRATAGMPPLIENWTPRSRYWYDSAMDGIDPSTLASQMGIVLYDHESEVKESVCNQSFPTIKTLHRNEQNVVVAVEVTTALTESEAQGVQKLASSLRNHDMFASTQFEHRSFGPKKGGNDCTYLAPLLQTLLPDTTKKIISVAELAWEGAGWNDLNGLEEDEDYDEDSLFPPPSTLGIRTSEHLSYDGWRSLEPHRDIGSIYTCNIALKEPTNYDGGEFFFYTGFDESTELKLLRLSALVFLSDALHGVRPISGGVRESFVTEFWKNDDAPLGMNRPTTESWEEFVDEENRR